MFLAVEFFLAVGTCKRSLPRVLAIVCAQGVVVLETFVTLVADALLDLGVDVVLLVLLLHPLRLQHHAAMNAGERLAHDVSLFVMTQGRAGKAGLLANGTKPFDKAHFSGSAVRLACVSVIDKAAAVAVAVAFVVDGVVV